MKCRLDQGDTQQTCSKPQTGGLSSHRHALFLLSAVMMRWCQGNGWARQGGSLKPWESRYAHESHRARTYIHRGKHLLNSSFKSRGSNINLSKYIYVRWLPTAIRTLCYSPWKVLVYHVQKGEDEEKDKHSPSVKPKGQKKAKKRKEKKSQRGAILKKLGSVLDTSKRSEHLERVTEWKEVTHLRGNSKQF